MKLWRKPLDFTETAITPGQVGIDREKCKGCGYCAEFCPRGVLKTGKELNPKGYFFAVIADGARCLACGYCEVICPEFATRVTQSSDDAKK